MRWSLKVSVEKLLVLKNYFKIWIFKMRYIFKRQNFNIAFSHQTQSDRHFQLIFIMKYKKKNFIKSEWKNINSFFMLLRKKTVYQRQLNACTLFPLTNWRRSLLSFSQRMCMKLQLHREGFKLKGSLSSLSSTTHTHAGAIHLHNAQLYSKWFHEFLDYVSMMIAN